MGYSEPHCLLCGVSFNVSRCRTIEEPIWKTWDYALVNAPGESDVEFALEHCSPSSACMIAIESDETPPKVASASFANFAGPEDGAQRLSDFCDLHKMKPYSDVQHVQAADCKGAGANAYSGLAISTEQMRGIHAFVAVMDKDEKWAAQDDDAAFEIDGNFFISALSTYVGDLEGRFSKFAFPRHGHIEEVTPSEHDGSKWPGLNFRPAMHASCLEIFCHVSQQRLACVDLAGLLKWQSVFVDFDYEHPPRNEAASRGREQWWNHEPGDEYLAANPVLVPEWRELLRSCVVPVNSAFDVRNSPFLPLGSGQKGSDPFLTLPPALLDTVLRLVSSSDVASLRVASRAFTHLPTLHFRHMLVEDLPWVWEATLSDTHRAMVKLVRDRTNPLTSRDRRMISAVVHSVLDNRPDGETFGTFEPWRLAPWHDYVCDHTGLWVSILDKKRESGLSNEQLIDWAIDYLWQAAGGAEEEISLPLLQTDWHKLYCGAKRLMRDCKGIQNRARIWEDVSYICDMIADKVYGDEDSQQR